MLTLGARGVHWFLIGALRSSPQTTGEDVTRPHNLFASLAATLVCVGCTSSATAPSGPNPSGPPASHAAAKPPTVAEPVDLNLGYLRQKADQLFDADSIETVRGVGYWL